MKRIAIVLAVLAALITSGIAVASASASTEFIVKGGGSTGVSLSGGKSVLKAGSISAECESNEAGKGMESTSNTRTILGATSITFHGCKVGTAKCTTKGATAGTIETVVLLTTLSPASGGGVDAYMESTSTKGTHTGEITSFECGVIKVKVTGCLTGEVTKAGGFSHEHTLKSILGTVEDEESSGTKFNCELKANGGAATLGVTDTLSSVAEIEVV